MRYVTAIATFILSFTLIAQDAVYQADSAYHYCVKHPDDTVAFKSFNGLLNNIMSSNPDTVSFYYKEFSILAKNAGSKAFESRACNGWGICMEYLGRPDSAIVLYNKALELALQTSNEKLLADTYNNLGIVYSLKGLYELSLEYTLKALAIQEELQDSNGMATMYNNIGLRYSEIQQQDKAIDYYLNAINLNSALGNKNRLCSNYSNLGRSFFLKELYDTARLYYIKGLALAKGTENVFNQSLCYTGLAYIELQRKNLVDAHAYADSTLAASAAIEDEIGIQGVDLLKGYIYAAEENPKEALFYLLRFEEWSESASVHTRDFEMYHLIAKAYEKLRDYPKALHYMEKFAFIKDTVFNDQKELALEQISIFKLEKEQKENELLQQQVELGKIAVQQEKTLRNTFIVIGILLVLLIAGISHRFISERRTKKALEEKNQIIQQEKERSESLLLNILPQQVAEELKLKGESTAKEFDEVTVLFTDFEAFTNIAEHLSARDLVAELNTCFKAFDEIITELKLEKIKTIGDAYMAASGLHLPRNAGAKEAVLAALKMQAFIQDRYANKQDIIQANFQMRVGIHTGPVVAGIVGVKKFQYDIWGDTVNTASRMESMGEVSKVNISQATYELLRDDPQFSFESRGKVDVKGKGEMEMWFVSKRSEALKN